jgi:hypothetical protein
MTSLKTLQIKAGRAWAKMALEKPTASGYSREALDRFGLLGEGAGTP